MEKKYDLIVIGGGPAGYPAAIAAAQLGKKALCIEEERAGGTCLNWGCIPTKALLKTAEIYETFLNSSEFGVSCSNISVNFKDVMERSRKVADSMGGGVEFLFKKNKVDYIVGRGQIVKEGVVKLISGEKKDQVFETTNILIATGCKPRLLPGVKLDGQKIMTSREALVMKTMPKSLIVIGAGAVGIEFAYFFNTFGCDVTLIEMLPRIAPLEDEDISAALTTSFKKRGIKIFTEATAENTQTTPSGVKLDLVNKDKRTPLQAEALLLSIGVIPNLEGLLPPTLNLDLHKGSIKVNDHYQTNIKGIYAAGDIIGAPWLAHVATFEALQAVKAMFNQGKPKRVQIFPSCTYCQPQIASIGLTEAAAKAQGIRYKIGKFPFAASGKAVASKYTEGFVKIIISEEYGEILGAHIIGREATELIAEYALAMNLEATAEDIHHTIHPHPTFSEALAEAAAHAEGRAIHI